MVLVGMAALAGGIAFRMADLRLAVVLSDSMKPTVQAGDLAVTEPFPASTVAVGDIIVVIPPGDTAPRMHRVIALTVENGQSLVTTKGDANRVPDPKFSLSGDTAYRMVASIPFIGWLTQVRGPLLIVAGLLVGLILIRSLFRKESPLRTGPSPA